MSNETASSKRPTHTAYSVREYQQGGQRQADWSRIGVAWAHKDGAGFDIILDAFPIDARVALRKSNPKPKQA